MSVTATRKAEILEEAVKDAVKRHEEWEDGILDDGFGVFARGKPQARLQAYLQGTLPEDLDLVMDPDYWDLRAEGKAPPLRCEQVAQSEMARAQQWLAAGLPAPQPSVPMMWVHLAGLPNRMLEKISRDFGSLYRAEAKKVAGQIDTLMQELSA
jgi:hypothetical protein